MFCPSTLPNLFQKINKSLHSRSKSATKNKNREYESAKTNEKSASVERIKKNEHSNRKKKNISLIPPSYDNENSKKKINNINENNKKNALQIKKAKNIQGLEEKTSIKKYHTCTEKDKEK